MQVSGSKNEHFRKAIPKDLLEKVRGAKLYLPIGDKVVNLQVTDKATHIKVSLRTSDPAEIKIRHANLLS